MVYITAVHMSGGTAHEHISSLRWRNPSTGATGDSSREAVIGWIENENGVAKVQSSSGDVGVGVVNASPKYLRTHANGQWTDNLLALPRY